jgi:hypothetical protein
MLSRTFARYGLVNVAGYRSTLPDDTLSDEVFENLNVTGVVAEGAWVEPVHRSPKALTSRGIKFSS